MNVLWMFLALLLVSSVAHSIPKPEETKENHFAKVFSVKLM